MNIKRARKF